MSTPESGSENYQNIVGEVADRNEVCLDCRNECHDLDCYIGQETLVSGDTELRAQYLLALAKSHDLKNPDRSAKVLLEYETEQRVNNPEFDITTLPQARLKRILERAASLNSEQTDNAKVNQEAKNTEIAERDYQAKIETLKSSGKSNVEIIQTLVNDPDMPESERAKLGSFAQLISLASTPDDQALITEKINVLNIAALPEPQQFITFQVFDSPEHKTGFSEAFQEKVATAYGMTKPPKVVAHSDVRKLASHQETYTDPETGEVKQRYLYDSSDNMAEFRPGVGTYMDGEKMMLKPKFGGAPKDVSSLSDTQIGYMAEMMGFQAAAKYFGATGFVETMVGTPFNSVLGDAYSPDKIQTFRQILSALTGGFSGYDGEVFDAREKMGLIRKQMEVLSPSGQANELSQDPSGIKAVLEELGLHQNGQANLERLKNFGQLTQTGKLSAGLDQATIKAELDRFE